MSTFMSKDLQNAFDAAQHRALKKRSRLRAHIGDEIIDILRFDENTFSVSAEDTDRLRGLVDIFDGGRHLYQALIVTSRDDGAERIFEFKRNTMASDRAALDYFLDPDAPVGLIEAR